MEILPGIIADSGAIFIKEQATLILADLHIGYEDELIYKGVLLPKTQEKWYKEELTRLCKKYKPWQIILNGDIKHEFGRISQQEWSGIRQLIEHAQQYAEVVVVGGNHDNMLEPILRKMNIPLEGHILLGNILIVHGDKELDAFPAAKRANTVIIGHEHPMLKLVESVKTESVKCYLTGTQNKKDIIVMPAWNPYSTGTDVLRERPLGPLLTTFGKFSAYAVLEHEVLAFGLIEEIRHSQSQ